MTELYNISIPFPLVNIIHILMSPYIVKPELDNIYLNMYQQFEILLFKVILNHFKLYNYMQFLRTFTGERPFNYLHYN